MQLLRNSFGSNLSYGYYTGDNDGVGAAQQAVNFGTWKLGNADNRGVAGFAYIGTSRQPVPVAGTGMKGIGSLGAFTPACYETPQNPMFPFQASCSPDSACRDAVATLSGLGDLGACCSSCEHGGPCSGSKGVTGLGFLDDISSSLGGLDITSILIYGVGAYLLFKLLTPPSERTAALREARSEYRKKRERIKKSHSRTRAGKYAKIAKQGYLAGRAALA